MRRAPLPLALLLAVALAAPAASQPGAGGHDSSDGRPPAAPQHGTGGPGGGQHSSGGRGAPNGTAIDARIGFDAVRPERLDIVTGESVRWTNDSARVHTVTADDDRFDSGWLTSTQTFTRRFAAAGEAPYHCTLHPRIRGVVAVHDLLLDAPAQAAAPKRPFPISGRSALAAGSAVAIEADSGAGFAPVTSAAVGDDGRFAVRIAPTATASYRAVAGGVTSAPVRLLVLDRRISLTVRRSRSRVRLRAKVTPASRGGRIVLQLFLPERFGWWPVRTAVLGKASGASLTIHPRRRLRARVRYTLADGATALATSRTVHVGPPAKHHR